MKKITTKEYLFPFILVTSLFFFWGLIHNLDPVLIPHLRKAFLLNDLESSLVDSSVFIAYFVMALPAGFIMRKYGYKTGIIMGLIFFGVGSVLFVPAANTLQYGFFLGALFIIASGLAFLETAANPYVTILGPAETATQRLNFSQSFNGLAAFMAPTFIGPLILSGKQLSKETMDAMTPQALHEYLSTEASSVKMPYLILGMVIFLIAIKKTKLMIDHIQVWSVFAIFKKRFVFFYKCECVAFFVVKLCCLSCVCLDYILSRGFAIHINYSLISCKS